MKRITILFISLIFVFSARAQSLNPTVNATAGGYFSTPDVSLSWTLGEIATETFSGSSAILTGLSTTKWEIDGQRIVELSEQCQHTHDLH